MPPDPASPHDSPAESAEPPAAEHGEISFSVDAPRPRDPQPRPRNFLERDEQRRLFWTVMPPAIVLVVLGVWLERAFFSPPGEPALPQVDTRLPGGPRGAVDGSVADAVVMEAAPEPFPQDRAAPAEALAKVRDDTVFREADSDAWFALWQSLRQRDPAALDREAGPTVGFTELFGQPRSFRGRLVRLRGTLRRLQRVGAAPNAAGIEGYWQGWLDPEGGPASPIVIYFLALPETIRPGTRLVEPVEVVGYFFKRWAYQATDTIRTAPLVLSLEPTALAAPARPQEPNITGILLWTGGILAMIGFLVMLRGRSHRARTPLSSSRLSLLLVLIATSLPFSAAAESPPMTAGDYLGRFDLAATDREALGPLDRWNDRTLDMSLRLLGRLDSAPADLLATWSHDAAAVVSPPGTDDGDPDQLIRIAGRAVLVRDLPLSPEMAQRHGRETVSLVRVIDSAGLTIDLIAGAVPAAWPRDTTFSEPADAVGVGVAHRAGPAWTDSDGPDNAADEPPTMTLVTRRVAWRPGTPLGSLGMDYSLFDGVQDGRKLVADDADAFYGMLAAVGRATPQGLEAAAQPSDVFALIDPQAGWLETHRGAAVRIHGTARRAIRIAVDEPYRRRQIGSDHYWEVYVFVRTPTAVQVHGRLQDTYPFVCCFRELPPGMPNGERIAEDIDVSGFVFKRYRYPLSATATAGQQQESPLLISRSPRWLPDTEPAETRQFDRIFGSGLIVVTLLLIGVGWAASRRPQRLPTPAQQIRPPAEPSAEPSQSEHGDPHRG